MAICNQWIYVLALATITSSTAVLAQDKPANYPTRPIRIIISSPPGGASDAVEPVMAKPPELTRVILDLRSRYQRHAERFVSVFANPAL